MQDTDKITVEALVYMPEAEKPRVYTATQETLARARFEAEKKARAYLRRHRFSVRNKNVIKKRCPDCETRTEFTAYNLGDEIPNGEEDTGDDLDFLLGNWSM